MKAFQSDEKVIYQKEYYSNSVRHITRQITGLFVRYIKHRKAKNQLCYVKFPRNKSQSRLAERKLFRPTEIFGNPIEFPKEHTNE